MFVSFSPCVTTDSCFWCLISEGHMSGAENEKNKEMYLNTCKCCAKIHVHVQLSYNPGWIYVNFSDKFKLKAYERISLRIRQTPQQNVMFIEGLRAYETFYVIH